MINKEDLHGMWEYIADDDEAFEELLDEKLVKNGFENLKSSSYSEFFEQQEIGRCNIIKELLSSDHQWMRYTVVSDDGFYTDLFWCRSCKIYGSVFDHIGYLPAISKVRDYLPSYTPHNKYLKYSCEFLTAHVQQYKNDLACIVCGLPEKLKSKNCTIIPNYHNFNL